MLNCAIVSKEKSTSYKNLVSITLPTLKGELQILPNYAESFILLTKGNIVLRAAASQTLKIVKITEGQTYIHNNLVVIIC